MKASLSTPIMCVILLLSSSARSNAHQDAVLSLTDGALTPLPAEYSPARFDVERKILRIKNRELTFIPFIASLFPADDDFQLKITASWYHNFNILPPYVAFDIRKKEWNFAYHILINLRTLEILKLEVRVEESDSSARHLPIDLMPWKDELRKSVRKLEPKKGRAEPVREAKPAANPVTRSNRSTLNIEHDPEHGVAYIAKGKGPPIIMAYGEDGFSVLRVPEAFGFHVQINRSFGERAAEVIWFETQSPDKSTQLIDAVAITPGDVTFVADDEFLRTQREYRQTESLVQELLREETAHPKNNKANKTQK